jgi:hypothetical protein
MSPEAKTSPTAYPASRLAAALGLTKRAVLDALHAIQPVGQTTVGGNLASAWSVDQLPETYRTRLATVARKGAYRDVEALLASPPDRWPPTDFPPLKDVPAEHLTQAARLRDALAGFLDRKANDPASVEELARDGVREYQRVFGHAITTRHWRYLFERTRTRDAGEGEFGRLDLYLSDRVPRVRPNLTAQAAGSQPAGNGPAAALPQAVESRLVAPIQAAIDTFSDAKSPSQGELAFLFHTAFESLEAVTDDRCPEKRLKRALVAWIHQRAAFLEVGEDSLRRDLDRRLARWRAGGRTPAALADRRADTNGRRRLSLAPEDRNRLVGTALMAHDGELAPAYRALRDAGDLPSVLKERNTAEPARKSYVPATVRRECGPEIRSLLGLRHGPRQARLEGVYLERDWSDVAAGDQFTSDDFTLEVYFWIADEAGQPVLSEDGKPVLTRGQWLPMIDCRSKRILADLLIPESRYTGLHIRTLMNRSAESVGLPRESYLFENGIWRASKLVGWQSASSWGDFCTTFTDRTGVQIRHAMAGNARAKIAENVGKLVQARLRDLPGWVGRNEQVLKIEGVQAAKREVLAGRKHPTEAGFMEFTEYRKQIDKKTEAYNAEAQESRVMGGDRVVSMSPDQAWEHHQRKNDAGQVVGLTRFADAPELRWIVAAHQERRRVTRNGIIFTLSGERYAYHSEELTTLQGVEVETYFDPELPDFLTAITDSRKVLTVPRCEMVPACASREELAEAMKGLARFNRKLRARFGEVKQAYVPPARIVLTDRETHQVGKEILAQREEAVSARENAVRSESRARRLSRETGLPVSPDVASDPNRLAAMERLAAALKGEPNEPQNE